MTTDAEGSGGELAHCEWCGAEYPVDPQEAAPQAPPRRAAAPAPPGAEPLTHCEWCGAEYPVPDGDS